MATTVSNLSINFGANTSALKTGVRDVQKTLATLGTSGAIGGALSNSAGGLGAISGGLSSISSAAGPALLSIGAVTTAVSTLAGWGLRLSAQSQQVQSDFAIMLGSAGQANTLTQQLRELAETTPLNFAGIAENTQVLLQFGVAGAEVLPTLRMLGDISGGNAERMQRLSLAFGQISAAGRLMGQDLLQLINAGFNPLQEISKNTGRSMMDLKKDMENGQISLQMVKDAFTSATSEGGRFNGRMEASAKLLGGKWDKFTEAVMRIGMAIGDVLAPGAKIALEALTDLANAFQRYIVARGPIITEWVKRFAQLFADISKEVVKGIDMLAKYYDWWTMIFRRLGIVGPEIKKPFEELTDVVKDTDSVLKGAFDEAFANAIKETEKLAKTGEALTKSLRLPDEIYADTIAELKELNRIGAITGETFNRGMQKATDDLKKAAEKQKEAVEAMRALNVGAAVRGTAAGFSAVIQGQNANKQLAATAARQLEQLREANRHLEAIEKRPPVDLRGAHI